MAEFHILVNHNGQTYKVSTDDIESIPSDCHVLLNRFALGVDATYKITGTAFKNALQDPSNLRDTDLLLINSVDDFLNLDGTYKITWPVFAEQFVEQGITAEITQNISTSLSARSGASNTFTVGVTTTGDPSVTYQWYQNGVAISGADGASFTVNPWYTSDSGTTIYCQIVASKSGQDSITLNSNTCSVTVSKANNGGSYQTVSRSSPYRTNTSYDDPDNFKHNESDAETGDLGGSSWKKAWQIMDTDRRHTSYAVFVRDNDSHQRNMFWKRDHARGRNNDSVCGQERWEDPGKGYNGAAEMAWYIARKPSPDYPSNHPDGGGLQNYRNWGRGPANRDTHGGDDTELQLDLSYGEERRADVYRGSGINWQCPLNQVPEGNSIETDVHYEWCEAYKLQARNFYTWLDRPTPSNQPGGNPRRLYGACGQSDDYGYGKARRQDPGRIGYRGHPYNYAYQERSRAILPGNTGVTPFFNDDKWYSSSLTEEQNAERKAELDQFSFLVTYENGVYLFNGQPLTSVDFKVNSKYTFFMPGLDQVQFSIDGGILGDRMVRDGSTMIGFAPLREQIGVKAMQLTGGQILNLNITEDIVDLTNVPFQQLGYYPLYETEEAANNASPDGTSHVHELEGYTRYMPDGVDQFHGDYEHNDPDGGIPSPYAYYNGEVLHYDPEGNRIAESVGPYSNPNAIVTPDPEFEAEQQSTDDNDTSNY